MIKIEFNPWAVNEVRQYQEELRRDIDTRRLVSHEDGEQKQGLANDLLGFIGRGLVEYGNRLQRRYRAQNAGQELSNPIHNIE